MKHASNFVTGGATLLLVVLLCVFTGGCAHYPETPPLAQVGTGGYRPANVTRPGQFDDLLIVLAISGGGMHAALPASKLGPFPRATGHRYTDGPDVVDTGRPNLTGCGGAGSAVARSGRPAPA